MSIVRPVTDGHAVVGDYDSPCNDACHAAKRGVVGADSVSQR